jgi:hypothetical protein
MIMLLWPGYMLRLAITIFLHAALKTLHKSRIATRTRMALESEMMRKPIVNAALRLVTNRGRTRRGMG